MTYINELILIAAVIIMLIGIAGCLLPVIPGPPIALISLFLVHYTGYADFQTKTLVIYTVLIILVTVVDYIFPVMGARRFGGTKRGMWGAAIGLIAGLILFPLFGFLIGPFIGAYIAEITGGMKTEPALKAAVGSFLGILAGTLTKIAICLVMAVHILVKVVF